MMMTSTTDPNLEMLDIVHKLASLSKASPDFAPSSSFTQNVDPIDMFTREFPNNKIVVTTSSSWSTPSSSRNNYSAAHISLTRPPPAMPSSQMPSNLNSSPGRRIKPVSAPRRPPDIQNRTLFPSIDDSMHELHSAFTTTTTPQQREKFPSNKPTSSGFSLASEKKLRNLEIKLQGRTVCDNADHQQEETSGQKLQPENQVNFLTPKRQSTETITKKRQCPRSAELFAEITPEIASKIDKLASEYSSLLDKNVSQNILEEISLLLQLIASTRPLTSTELEYTNIASKIGGDLTTVAQQIFFVIKVLTLQLNSSLVSIDPEVVQLLVDKYPHRIPKPFRKNFQAWCEIQREKGRKGMQEEPSRKPSEFHQCVTFRSETDGRSNFPSQGNFHSFCKQRDLFYSIKTLWEERKGTTTSIPGGRDQSSFGKNNGFSRARPSKVMASSTHREIGDPLHQNIRGLFNLNSTWVNLSHFAALFSAQYTMDSMEESRQERSVMVQDDVMKGLEQADPDRMAKLNNRMSSISELESGSTKDCFAFQQYFITTAASPSFNQHLVDRISFELQQIEDSLDSVETEAISEHEEEFLLRKSVLLAKLLGWIAFLPYREVDNNSNANVVPSRPNNTSLLDRETLSSKHVELRGHQRPPLDLFSILCNAIKKSRLTFTLPWIIEFLSSADYISLQLPAYKTLILLICSAYRNLFSVNENWSELCLENKNFLRFWCGNLFSLDVFPISFLHDSENNLTDQILNSYQPGKLAMNHPSDGDGAGSVIPIDAKILLGEQLCKLYFTVKFNHMKFTLHSGLQQQQFPATLTPSPFGNSGQHRHIRPISARPSPRSPKTISTDAELQRQLECSFFDLNSASVKRTVDFISDRIASNYVKILRKTLPDRRNELAQERTFDDIAAELCRTTMLQGVSGFIDSKCQVSVNLLIGETLSMDALKICQQIAERQTMDKVSQWTETHIKPEMFPEIPLASPPHPPSSTDAVITATGGEDSTTPTTPSFSVMITLHRCMKRLHDKFPVLDSAIDDILNCTWMGHTPGMISTLVDFGVTLIAFSPHILNAERQMKLICLWKPCWSSDCQLLSPRNILILSECSENVGTLSWTKLEEIILLLIEESLLDFETVEQDCFRLLREGLSPRESKSVSQLLKRLISSTKGDRRNHADGSSREVVEWISWFCSDDHYDGEF